MKGDTALFRYPGIALEAPTDDTITDYDMRNLTTYAALIFAHDDGEEWQAMAIDVLKLNVTGNEIAARHCCESHLERAQWFVEKGFHQLLEQTDKM